MRVEQLEQRQLLTILIDPIPKIQIDEGSAASLDAHPFTDTSPGGNYSAEIAWTANDASVPVSGTTPAGGVGPLRVSFDYRYDTDGFFGDQQRLILETAAEIVVGRLGDQLAGFTSSGSNQFTAQFVDPTTGEVTSISNFSAGWNELIVFVGSQDLEGETLGTGGAGGGTAREPFFSLVAKRGQPNAPETDVAPWGGSISFDSETRWYFGTSDEDLKGNERDFLSVAVHELIHVMGFTASTPSFERWILVDEFRGTMTRQLLDSNNAPLSEDLSHFEEGLEFDGQETSLDPSLRRGKRKLPTELDFAVLDDIGWQLVPKIEPGTVTASNVYGDNGTFDATLTVRNGEEIDSRTFQVIVSNVAPSVISPGDITGRFGDSINLSISFVDPGLDDTHTAMVDWGDGTGGSINVDQSTNRVTGSRVYNSPGTYAARVMVEDDDGGSTIESFTITVVPPPRGDWQNPNNRFDVSGNQQIDPLDALLVINELNERNVSSPDSGLLPPAPPNISAFLDVNGDDFVSPQDALDVINRLSNSAAVRLPTGSEPSNVERISTPIPIQDYFERFESLEDDVIDLLARNLLLGGENAFAWT